MELLLVNTFINRKNDMTLEGFLSILSRAKSPCKQVILTTITRGRCRKRGLTQRDSVTFPGPSENRDLGDLNTVIFRTWIEYQDTKMVKNYSSVAAIMLIVSFTMIVSL